MNNNQFSVNKQEKDIVEIALTAIRRIIGLGLLVVMIVVLLNGPNPLEQIAAILFGLIGITVLFKIKIGFSILLLIPRIFFGLIIFTFFRSIEMHTRNPWGR